MQIGRRIYYDTSTGNVLTDTGERQGFVKPITIEQDIATYSVLSERNRETFDFIELEFGELRQDFMECDGYRVDPDTQELEFSYPDPDAEPPVEPVYEAPLSQRIAELEATIDALLGVEA